MTPEERSLLERTYATVKENNEILLGIRRRSRIGVVIKIFYWTLIIGLSLGAFYFIQPYIEMITGVAGDIKNTSDSLSSGLQEFLN